jgi:Zn2+/Cd2+-exporting ATPase
LPVAASRRGRVYKVRGLDCAEEVAVLKQVVGPLVGGEDRLAFDVLNGRMTVANNERNISDEVTFNAIAATGMSAVTWTSSATKDDTDSYRRQQMLFTATSGIALLIGFTLHIVLAGGFAAAWRLLGSHANASMPWPEIAAYLAAALLGARFVVVKAWFAARNLRPDMHLLMTIAVIGAMAIGEWFEAATVSFLFALSLVLESWSVVRARRATAALLDLAPPTASVLRPNGQEETVPVDEVRLGSRFIVPAGERIPLDGRVTEGASMANQAPITGESVPVEKQPGAEGFAGTINGDGTLTIRATKTAEDTTLARIILMVEGAHARRAPSEQWVERFARVYTPAVMVLAFLAFLIPPLVLSQPWEEWLYRALVLLVIACPCALVISTPVSVVASLASAARAGVLIKVGSFIEMPARLQAIAMDKTGTITRGEPEVVQVIPLGGHTESELISRGRHLRRTPRTRWRAQFAATPKSKELHLCPQRACKCKRARD